MRYLNITKAIEARKGIQPLSERDLERLSRKFTIDFNFNSNHIEGNTLTYGQTERLLLFGKVTGEAQMKDLEEMKASNVGLNMMQEQAGLKDMPLTQKKSTTMSASSQSLTKTYGGTTARESNSAPRTTLRYSVKCRASHPSPSNRCGNSPASTNPQSSAFWET